MVVLDTTNTDAANLLVIANIIVPINYTMWLISGIHVMLKWVHHKLHTVADISTAKFIIYTHELYSSNPNVGILSSIAPPSPPSKRTEVATQHTGSQLQLTYPEIVVGEGLYCLL